MTVGRRLLRLLWHPARPPSRRQQLRSYAITLIVTPLIMLFPLALGFFVEPLWMFEDREAFGIFMLFFGGPWTIAAILLYGASRADKRP